MHLEKDIPLPTPADIVDAEMFDKEFTAGDFIEAFGMLERRQQPVFLSRQTPCVNGVKVGRNALCPCGSGRKYKKCCMKG